jgi:hypothetical protein
VVVVVGPAVVDVPASPVVVVAPGVVVVSAAVVVVAIAHVLLTWTHSKLALATNLHPPVHVGSSSGDSSVVVVVGSSKQLLGSKTRTSCLQIPSGAGDRMGIGPEATDLSRQLPGWTAAKRWLTS